MKKIFILIVIILSTCIHVSAMDIQAPKPPITAEKYMPEDTNSFAEDLWFIIKSALADLQPGITDAAKTTFSIIAVVILISILRTFTDTENSAVSLAGTIVVATMLLQPSNALIQLGISVINELSEYGKLLIPVMTTALAAQGGTTTSAALYTGTAVFNTFLTAGIRQVLIPLVYIFLALSTAISAINIEAITTLRSFIKWLMTWILKITIYLFTGYLGITGVVSGTTDAAAIKAAKITISGAVPVVGNIISDASEAILVSAGVLKSAAGIYGLLALIAIYIGPFIEIGIHYLLLKLTAAICGVFGCKQIVTLIRDFAAAMGFILAATGTICILLLISTVCFMKGVA